MQDPISDMLTRVRNAQQARKTHVKMPSNKLKVAIAKVLQEEGYIASYTVSSDVKSEITIELRYHHGKAVIQRIERVSKPGLKVYKACDELPRVLGGMGISIISTPHGVMSGYKAKQQRTGGEVICVVS